MPCLGMASSQVFQCLQVPGHLFRRHSLLLHLDRWSYSSPTSHHLDHLVLNLLQRMKSFCDPFAANNMIFRSKPKYRRKFPDGNSDCQLVAKTHYDFQSSKLHRARTCHILTQSHLSRKYKDYFHLPRQSGPASANAARRASSTAYRSSRVRQWMHFHS